MTWQLIRLDDKPASSWRNGGGTTRELLAWPPGKPGVAADWDWRLSVAEVTASGPFSSFDGVQRWFAVLQGEGVRLNMDGMGIQLTGHSPPFQFDGAVPVSCQLLGGATQDFNVMVRRGRGQARMERVNGQLGSRGLMLGTFVAAYAALEPAQLQLGDETPLDMPAHCLAWRVLGSRGTVQVRAKHALWMEITP